MQRLARAVERKLDELGGEQGLDIMAVGQLYSAEIRALSKEIAAAKAQAPASWRDQGGTENKNTSADPKTAPQSAPAAGPTTTSVNYAGSWNYPSNQHRGRYDGDRDQARSRSPHRDNRRRSTSRDRRSSGAYQKGQYREEFSPNPYAPEPSGRSSPYRESGNNRGRSPNRRPDNGQRGPSPGRGQANATQRDRSRSRSGSRGRDGHSGRDNRDYRDDRDRRRESGSRAGREARGSAVGGLGRGPGKKPDSVYCDGCGNTHPGGKEGCRLKAHPNFNSTTQRWSDTNQAKWLMTMGHMKICPGFYLNIDGMTGQARMTPFAGIKAPPEQAGTKVSPEIPDIHQPEPEQGTDGSTITGIHSLSNDRPNETVNICTLYGSDQAGKKRCRAERRREARAVDKTNPKPLAYVNGQVATVLLDSGAVDRNFITNECALKLNLTKLKLRYPITVTSIHGEEVATEVVIARTVITSHDQIADLTQVELIVIQKGPSEVIILMPTLL